MPRLAYSVPDRQEQEASPIPHGSLTRCESVTLLVTQAGPNSLGL